MNWEKFYDKAYSWILFEGPKILVALLVIIVGWWLIKLITKLLRNSLERRHFDASLLPFFVSVFTIALRVLLALQVMQILGIQMTIFTALVGAIGVAAGLALSGTLQNFASGILILLMKPYRVGDNIIAQGQEGTVNSIQIFYTVVTTYDNRTVIIPNSKLSNEVIINISREGKRRLDVEMKFSFAYSFENIKSLILQSINKMEGVLKEPTVRIGVSSIDPDGYKIMISTWLQAHGFQDAKLLFQQKLIDDLKAEGLKLPGMQ
jgi:small conductance mechanosensitive channel